MPNEKSQNLGLFEPRDACALIWGHIKPTLPLYQQRLAINVGYLRRTKEEADKDRQARQIEFDEWEERKRAPWFLDALDVWARQGSGIGSLGEGRPDFSTYNMLPVPISAVPDGSYIGGNHATETVQSWEVRMGRVSLPGHQLDAIAPTLSHLVLSDEDLKTLRSRFLLDQSIKNVMVLVGTRYTLNEKQLLTTSMLLKRVMGVETTKVTTVDGHSGG
ncbi:hypothetical protein V8E54_011441 [Elaphomyces granulatus]